MKVRSSGRLLPGELTLSTVATTRFAALPTRVARTGTPSTRFYAADLRAQSDPAPTVANVAAAYERVLLPCGRRGDAVAAVPGRLAVVTITESHGTHLPSDRLACLFVRLSLSGRLPLLDP